jgi:aspartyl-tRNA(Asn)/glutamyl-tRNA(Gln) amidotransferase subunit C
MSAPRVDRALVLHVAKLASLSLSDTEADRLTHELASIVAYVEQLEELDTTHTAPMAHVDIERLPWRKDVVRPGLSHGDALDQAPRAEQGGFSVPTFVE